MGLHKSSGGGGGGSICRKHLRGSLRQGLWSPDTTSKQNMQLSPPYFWLEPPLQREKWEKTKQNNKRWGSDRFLPFFQDVSVFSRHFPRLENCWANFKTFSRIQDSVWTLKTKQLTRFQSLFSEGKKLKPKHNFRLEVIQNFVTTMPIKLI